MRCKRTSDIKSSPYCCVCICFSGSGRANQPKRPAFESRGQLLLPCRRALALSCRLCSAYALCEHEQEKVSSSKCTMGENSNTHSLASAELYNPSTGT